MDTKLQTALAIASVVGLVPEIDQFQHVKPEAEKALPKVKPDKRKLQANQIVVAARFTMEEAKKAIETYRHWERKLIDLVTDIENEEQRGQQQLEHNERIMKRWATESQDMSALLVLYVAQVEELEQQLEEAQTAVAGARAHLLHLAQEAQRTAEHKLRIEAQTQQNIEQIHASHLPIKTKACATMHAAKKCCREALVRAAKVYSRLEAKQLAECADAEVLEGYAHDCKALTAFIEEDNVRDVLSEILSPAKD